MFFERDSNLTNSPSHFIIYLLQFYQNFTKKLYLQALRKNYERNTIPRSPA